MYVSELWSPGSVDGRRDAKGKGHNGNFGLKWNLINAARRVSLIKNSWRNIVFLCTEGLYAYLLGFN